MPCSSSRTSLAALAVFSIPSLALLVGCDARSRSDGAPGTVSSEANVPALAVLSTSVGAGQVVRLDHLIDVRFSGPVDFTTVSTNTFRVRERFFGTQAAGTLELVAPDTVRFRPACPVLEDLSDAGLRPATAYDLLVPGLDGGGPTIRSVQGAPLRTSTLVPFSTPSSSDPAQLFGDPLPGAPRIVVRAVGSVQETATHLELGLDPQQRVYFERDPTTGAVALPVGFRAPINPYSRVAERVAWILHLDQAVTPSAANLAPDRIGVEYLVAGSWVPLAVRAVLETNCTDQGARIRLEPMGILPQASRARAFLGAGFANLVGQALPVRLVTAPAVIATSFDPGTSTPGADADERFEDFQLGGTSEGSLEDTTSPLPSARAPWGGGRLEARGFQGTGGPGGDFDWHIPPGVTFVFDTIATTITGGPGGVPTSQQLALNGVIDVRDVFVPASSRIVFIGPNPVTLLATGTVVVEGELALRGSDNPGVGTLNTTNQPEPGASGQAGGGRGGTGSPLAASSSPRGGHGFGAFGVVDGGGRGGEASFHPTNKNDRRGAGGGGGGHGTDVLYDFQGFLVRCQTLVGMDGEQGRGGGPNGMGALGAPGRAQGGALGAGPFTDADPTNDFFGGLELLSGQRSSGELPRPWAGAGGGGGGDAVRSDSFPLVPFNIGGDEKGAGGGGGGGSLHVMAFGPIVIGASARVIADGGHGGGGENTSFFDRVGGGSGAGAGGSIVLESLSSVEAGGFAPNAGPFYADNPNLAVHSQRPISALGGQGGAGHDNFGGANESGPTLWRCDAIPVSHFEGLAVPPSTQACYMALRDTGDPLGPVLGAGGDGAPGVVQLHVPSLAALSFPALGGSQDVSPVFAPPPIGWEGGAFAGFQPPTFGARSSAQSRWIALGAARAAPGGASDQVELFFHGLGAGGLVPSAAGQVVLDPPLLGPAPLAAAPTPPYLEPGGRTIVLDAAPLAGFPDVYERNPALARGSTVRLRGLGAPGQTADFTVVAASYDAALDRLALTTDGSEPPMSSFAPPGGVEAEWIPRSFRVVTAGARDRLDPGRSIRFGFDATRADGLGRPDPAQAYSVQQGFAPDPALLNAADWDFVRFRVEFDLDTGMSGFDPLAPRPALEFTEVPFRF